jgi:hypothetical protein
MQNLAWAFQIGLATVHQIINETVEVICEVLAPMYLKTPATEEDWINISDGFSNIWNFPNCIGALDGKHISIQAPPNSGSIYFNYKKTFSIVLLATCDQITCLLWLILGPMGPKVMGAFSVTAFLDQDWRREL